MKCSIFKLVLTRLHNLDYRLLAAIHRKCAFEPIDSIAHIISVLGIMGWGFNLLLIFVWSFGLINISVITLLLLITCTFIASVATEIVKLFFRRPRPFMASVPIIYRGKKTPRSTSFFSGHATTAAFAAVGTLILIGGPIAYVSICWAFLVGLSRMQQAAHYPFDVLTGWAMGSLWALAFLLF